MNNNNGALSFNAVFNNKQIMDAIRQSNREVEQFGANFESQGTKIDNTAKRVGQAIGTYFTFQAGKQFVQSIVSVRNEFQQLEIAFTTMLRSKSKADALVAEIANIAATTPFGMKEVASGTKMLLAYGSEVGNVREEIMMLGDVASGVGAPLNDMIYLYGTLRTQGRAYAQDIRQFAGRGIPIYQALADVMKINKSEVSKFVEEGKVGFKEVEQAFKNMTNADTGQFAGLMEAQSKSIGGNLERLGDAWDMMLNKIGQSNEGLINSSIGAASGLIENYETVGKVLAGLIATYGSYKAAVMVLNVMNSQQVATHGAIASAQYQEAEAKSINAIQTYSLAKAHHALLEARILESQAALNSMRANVSELAVRKTQAAAALSTHTAKVTAAQLELGLAQAQHSAAMRSTNVTAQEIAVKKLSIAETNLQAASESALAARKAATTRTTEFNTAKTAVETQAKAVGALSTQAQASATTLHTAALARDVAASNLSTVATTRLTIAQRIGAGATIAGQRAMALLNATMLTNPFVAITVAVAALSYAIYSLSTRTSSQERAQEQLNEKIKETKDLKESQRSAANALISKMNSETETVYRQVEAYKELIKLFPELAGQSIESLKSFKPVEWAKMFDKKEIEDGNKELEKTEKLLIDLDKAKSMVDPKAILGYDPFETAKGMKLVKDVWDATYEDAIAGAKEYVIELNNAKKTQAEAIELERINNLSQEDKIQHYSTQKQILESQIAELKKQETILPALVKGAYNLQNAFNSITLNNLTAQLNTVNTQLLALAGIVGGGNAPKSLASLGALKAGSKEKYENATTDADRKKYFDEMQAYDAEMKKLDISTSSVGRTAKKTSKAVKEIFEVGSIKWLNEEIQKLEEQISRLGEDRYNEAAKLNDDLKLLTERRLTAERALGIAETKDEFEAKKQAYEKYKEWMLSQYGRNNDLDPAGALKTAQLAGFGELLEGGGTWAIYLERQLNAIVEKYTEDVEGVIKVTEDGFSYIADLSPIADLVTQEDYDKLVNYQIELSKALGQNTVSAIVDKNIERIKDQYDTEFEYIKALEKAKEDLHVDNPFYSEYSKAFDAEIKAVSKSLADNLKSFLESVGGSLEAIDKIQKKYQELRKSAQAKGLPTTEIDKAEENELLPHVIQRNKELISLQNKYYTNNRKGMKQRIDDLNKEIELLAEVQVSLGNSTELEEKIIKLIKEKEEAQGGLEQFDIQLWSEWLGIITSASDEMSELGGVLGGLGSILSGMGQSVNKISAAFQNAKSGNTSNGDAYAAGGEFIIWAITSIASASKKRKEAEKSNLLDLQALQNTYNQTLLEEIRLRSILNENVYFKNYAGRIQDSIDSASESLKLYADLLSKINDQEAKIDIKKVVDWGAVGKGAGVGAATGATIGSVIPVIGTAIGAAVGAVVGAIVGLFSQKSKDVFAPLLEAYPELITAEGTINKTLAESLLTTNQLSDSTKEWLQSVLDASEAYKEALQQITDIVAELTGSMGGELRDVLVEAFQAGEDAALKFSQTVEKTLSNLLSNLIFSSVFNNAFDMLQKDLENAMMGMGGKSFQQVFAEFLSQSDDLTKQFNEIMKEAEEQGKKFGLDLFDSAAEGGANSMTGIARSITEETGSAMVGQLNAIRMYQADMVNSMQRMYVLQNNFLPYLEHLRAIERILRSTSSAPSDFSEFGG